MAKRLAMPADYTLCDDTVWLLLDYENGAQGCVSCNRFSHAVSQATELYGTEGTIYTTTDATNPFQSVPMAVYTNRDYAIEELPDILRNHRWPQLFWVEDIVNRPVQKRWTALHPPREPNNYTNMTRHFMDCIIHDEEPLVSGEDGAAGDRSHVRSIQVDGDRRLGGTPAAGGDHSAALRAAAG